MLIPGSPGCGLCGRGGLGGLCGRWTGWTGTLLVIPAKQAVQKPRGQPAYKAPPPPFPRRRESSE